MRTEADWDQEITKITSEIHQKYPELVKYISEIPLTLPNGDNKDVTLKSLEDYYNTLVELIQDYSKTHSKNN